MAKDILPEDNPLLNPPSLPHGAPPLDRVKPEHFLPALKTGIATAKAEIDTIKKNPDKPTFSNTIEAMEFSGQLLNYVGTIFHNIESANGNEELRAIEDDIKAATVRHSNDVMLDADLFKRIKSVYDDRANLTLTREQEMLLDKTYKAFVRSGALLDETGKERLREIDERMSALSTEFKNNCLKDTEAFKLVLDDDTRLSGVPDRAKEFYAHVAKEAGMDGKFIIPLSPPPIDILMYADDRELRREIAFAFASVGWAGVGGNSDNSPVIKETVMLRHERANLLGFDDHASYVLAERMAKSSKTVNKFLDDNQHIYLPAAESYLARVKDYAEKNDGITDFQSWDFQYYNRRMKEEAVDLNLEELRPYFDLEKTLEGLRTTASKLFQIDFNETSGKYPVYHPDVKVFEVTDQKTGAMVGLFYADYYARPGAKQSGAWMTSFRDRGLTGHTSDNEFPIVANVCNFAKPKPGEPTLLSIEEVRTVFHEFGHGLHGLLAEGNYKSLTGTNVSWDFVELPSQLMENWAKSPEVLESFARHYKTGDKLDPALFAKIDLMENYDAAYVGLRQTFLGKIDMAWHSGDPTKISSVEKLEDDLIAGGWLFPRASGPVSSGFKHIFAGGYSAGYYSYKWAEVLEADVFEAFQQKGLFDQILGGNLRKHIYSAGGTEEPNVLFFRMMGRDPDPEANFRREGILPKKKVSSVGNGLKPKPPGF